MKRFVPTIQSKGDRSSPGPARFCSRHGNRSTPSLTELPEPHSGLCASPSSALEAVTPWGAIIDARLSGGAGDEFFFRTLPLTATSVADALEVRWARLNELR